MTRVPSVPLFAYTLRTPIRPSPLRATTMKRKLQVFVSSTYSDLIDERQAAVAAILKAGHIPAGMELFTAGDKSQMKTIERWIDESDVFMLILGGRYGSIEPTTNLSYTPVISVSRLPWTMLNKSRVTSFPPAKFAGILTLIALRTSSNSSSNFALLPCEV